MIFFLINEKNLTATYIKPRIILKVDYHIKEVYKDISAYLEIIQEAKIRIQRE